MHKPILSKTLLAVITVDLLALTTDSTISWTSPSLPKLVANSSINPLGYPITSDEISWIGSLLSIGAVLGPLPSFFLADKIGRKYTLLLISIPFLASYLILAFPQNIYWFYVARILAGIGGGAGNTLLPMYIAEVAEDSNRGSLSVSLNVFWCLGSLLPYILGPYIPYLWFNLILAAFPLLFFVLFLVICPETPYYLIRNKKTSKAEQTLTKLRSKSVDGIGKEVEHIKTVLGNEQRGSFFDLFKSKINLKALGISLTLITLQQLSGINAVMTYTQFIFDMAAGDDSQDGLPSEISSLIIGTVFFVSSFIIIFVADKTGRRVLMIISSLGVSASMALFGAFFYVKNSTEYDIQSLSWVPIACLISFMVTFNLGMGSLPWTISSELFSMELRSLGASLVSLFCCLNGFFVTKFFASVNETLGEAVTFWIFAVSGLISAFFTYFVVPETRGKSFKEIQENLGK